MANRKGINRYLILVKRVKRGDYPSFEVLKDFVEEESMYLSDGLNKISLSKRTLQRDLREIRYTFGIDIEYSRTENGYYIDSDLGEQLNFSQMLEAHDVFQLLNASKESKAYVFPENTKPKGTEHFSGLLHAIKNRLKIKIIYEKYWTNEIVERSIAPYGLKESDYRWYVIARNDRRMAPYALDRIHKIEITTECFNFDPRNKVQSLYENIFGISISSQWKVEEVVVSMSPLQTKYFDSLPLHPTQHRIAETEDSVKYSIMLKLTDELTYKMLSYGDRITVLQPPALVDDIKRLVEQMSNNYAVK